MNAQHDTPDSERPRRPVLRWWDLGVAATLAVLGAIGGIELASEAPVAPLEAAVEFGVLALVGVWYVALGRAALRRAACDEGAQRRDFIFLGVLVLLCGLAAFVMPSYATLQVIGYPMIWTIVARYRDAISWSAFLALSVGAGFFVGFAPSGFADGLSGTAVMVVLSFAFAVAMGTWITRIFEQGERYRQVAERLRASQAEVAALSEQAGAGRERERLSRELHDTLTQTLAGLVMLSEQADRALAAGDTDRARDRVARVESAAREAVAEARALVATTQPLGDGGLEAAIERVVARLRADTGLDVSCEVETVTLDRERQVVLLRAVQEGLANARRHAGASRVHVRLVARPGGGALLHVDDDGVGPRGGVATASAVAEQMSAARRGEAGAGAGAGVDAGAGGAAGESGGFGLSGLAARARGVGGVVVFEASPLGGARLEVVLDAERAVKGDRA